MKLFAGEYFTIYLHTFILPFMGTPADTRPINSTNKNYNNPSDKRAHSLMIKRQMHRKAG